jgi:hypothetical protein
MNMGRASQRLFLSQLAAIVFASLQSQAPLPSVPAKYDAKHPPRFEDFPAAPSGTLKRKALNPSKPADRMFRTRLLNAAKEPPNFAQHYRVAIWGCGSNCFAGAMIDLQTGQTSPIPMAMSDGTTLKNSEDWMICGRAYEKSGLEFRIESRLMILRCGPDLAASGSMEPDTHYLLWESNRFRQLYGSQRNQAPKQR